MAKYNVRLKVMEIDENALLDIEGYVCQIMSFVGKGENVPAHLLYGILSSLGVSDESARLAKIDSSRGGTLEKADEFTLVAIGEE